jgi:hypothetical protein
LLAPWQAAQAQNEVVEAPNATPSTTLPEDSGDRVTLNRFRDETRTAGTILGNIIIGWNSESTSEHRDGTLRTISSRTTTINPDDTQQNAAVADDFEARWIGEAQTLFQGAQFYFELTISTAGGANLSIDFRPYPGLNPIDRLAPADVERLVRASLLHFVPEHETHDQILTAQIATTAPEADISPKLAAIEAVGEDIDTMFSLTLERGLAAALPPNESPEMRAASAMASVQGALLRLRLLEKLYRISAEAEFAQHLSNPRGVLMTLARNAMDVGWTIPQTINYIGAFASWATNAYEQLLALPRNGQTGQYDPRVAMYWLRSAEMRLTVSRNALSAQQPDPFVDANAPEVAKAVFDERARTAMLFWNQARGTTQNILVAAHRAIDGPWAGLTISEIYRATSFLGLLREAVSFYQGRLAAETLTTDPKFLAAFLTGVAQASSDPLAALFTFRYNSTNGTSIQVNDELSHYLALLQTHHEPANVAALLGVQTRDLEFLNRAAGINPPEALAPIDELSLKIIVGFRQWLATQPSVEAGLIARIDQGLRTYLDDPNISAATITRIFGVALTRDATSVVPSALSTTTMARLAAATGARGGFQPTPISRGSQLVAMLDGTAGEKITITDTTPIAKVVLALDSFAAIAQRDGIFDLRPKLVEIAGRRFGAHR